ncbi:hypothetical protein ABH935_004158 [Catenulispora sp. GAS73]|uniref:hypothetical protein n=1 Tax=Catenulispora sp. GAS73 TaxID=3156269 RepID=UPI0035136656
MSSEIITGVVGLLGAAIGSSGTLSTAWVTSRGDRRKALEQQAQARSSQERQLLRDSCTAFLSTMSEYNTTLWALADALANGYLDDAAVTALYQRVTGCYHEVSRAKVTLALVLPEDVQAQAVDAVNAVLALDDTVVRPWYLAWNAAKADGKKLNNRWGPFIDKRAAADEALTTMGDAVKKVIGAADS